MELNSKTKIGLTFPEIISMIMTIAMLIGFYYALSIRISENALNISELEKGRLQNAINIETMRKENREDYRKMIDKLDVLIYRSK